MGRFLFKIGLFWILFIGLVFGATCYVSYKVVHDRDFENYNTEENLVITPRNQHFDIMMLGLSHARNFSRHRNHQRVEKILNKSIINYGKGGGKGNVANQMTFYSYFLHRGNTVDTILYVISMPMFYANRLDENAYNFQREVFRPDFFLEVLWGPAINKGEKLYNYIREKYNEQWKKYGPWSAKSQNQVLEKFDTAVIIRGFKRAYVDGLEMDAFERNTRLLEKTVELAKRNQTDVVFLVTPSTFGTWPGHEKVMKFVKTLESRYNNVSSYDFSKVYLHRDELFYDHHHMNTKGIVTFTKEYLKPILGKPER
jgi:hypothetical protein